MKTMLEEYGKIVVVSIVIAIMIGAAALLRGGQIELPFQKITKLGSDEFTVATTGRSKPPTTVDSTVWIYIDKNNELVISKNKITAPADALLKEKSITVQGNGLSSNGSFDSKLVKSIKFAKKIRPISCRCWFTGFTNLAVVKNIENLYTDQCTDMGFMFNNCSSLKEINLKYFETSNVTNMRCMFSKCSSLKYLDLSSFDISKSKDVSYMMRV